MFLLFSDDIDEHNAIKKNNDVLNYKKTALPIQSLECQPQIPQEYITYKLTGLITFKCLFIHFIKLNFV